MEKQERSNFEEVGRLREDVSAMNESKADKSDLVALDARVGHLELTH